MKHTLALVLMVFGIVSTPLTAEVKSPVEDKLVWVESSFTKYLCKKTESLL